MSRYTGSSYKQARRTGFSLLENGKELARKPYTPGIHGQDIPGLAILNKTGNNYNDVYDENGNYITEVIEGQDSSGNKILNPDFANQFLTYH